MSDSPLTTALEQLRLKLLDLTGRNRLINFKHTAGKSLQFVEGHPAAIYQKLVEANNKANAKTPDATALMAANLAASKNGQAGTLLTGPGGVDPNSLKLGRSTLLGGG